MAKKITYLIKTPQNLEKKRETKKEIGNFVVESILKKVGGTISPVANNGKFKALSKDYKKKKGKLASPVPNLELTGNMLDALEFKARKDGVEVGIFKGKQALKADNHNKFTAKSLKTNVPKRQFIPKQGENFKRDIKKGIEEIIAENLKD